MRIRPTCVFVACALLLSLAVSCYGPVSFSPEGASRVDGTIRGWVGSACGKPLLGEDPWSYWSGALREKAKDESQFLCRLKEDSGLQVVSIEQWYQGGPFFAFVRDRGDQLGVVIVWLADAKDRPVIIDVWYPGCTGVSAQDRICDSDFWQEPPATETPTPLVPTATPVPQEPTGTPLPVELTATPSR